MTYYKLFIVVNGGIGEIASSFNKQTLDNMMKILILENINTNVNYCIKEYNYF